MAGEGISLKDELFNENTIGILRNCLEDAYPGLDAGAFYENIMSELPELELKERISWIRESIKKHITESYEETVHILKNSLDNQAPDQFIFAAYSDYVAVYGCSDEYLELSLEMLGEYTKWFSAEFAIRPFINNYPEVTMTKVMEWSVSDNPQQRRLASEGLRPKLPWANGITLDYKVAAKPLENLYSDNVRFVTRSVANHMNDISKMEPEYVIDRLNSWKTSGKQDKKEMAYIISHSLRTLVKQGHPQALEMLGYHRNPDIVVSTLSIKESDIRIGESLVFDFEIKAFSDEALMVDYVVDYPMKNGKRSSKVFKIKKMKVKTGSTYNIEKKHPFKIMTTKKLYSGTYTVALQINGHIYPHVKFFLMIS